LLALQAMVQPPLLLQALLKHQQARRKRCQR
jgi:hypothetical protein